MTEVENKVVPPVEDPAPVPPSEQKPQDIDFDKEFADIEARSPKHTQKEKATFAFKKQADRIREMGVDPAEILDITPKKEEPENPANEAARIVLRTNAEERARAVAKSESEVKVIMHYYDLLGNYDDAVWQAHKGRTKNAIEEMRRTPPAPSAPSGSGQKPVEKDIPSIPPEQAKRMAALGLKQVAPDRWEGDKVVLQYVKGKGWDQTFKK